MEGLLAAFGAGVLFGSSDALVRLASKRLSPLENLLLSLLVGTPFLWLAACLVGCPHPGHMILMVYAVAGLLNFVAGRLFFYYAIASLGASTAAVATSPNIALAALLAWPLLGERLTAEKLVGVALSTLAAVIASAKPSGKPLHGLETVKGLLAAIGALLSFTFSTLLVRYAGAASGAPLVGTAVSYTAALPVALLLAVKHGNKSLLRGSLSREHAYMILAALTVATAQLLRYLSLSLIPVAEAVVLIGLYPLHTTIFARAFGARASEKPGARHLFASITASAAVYLTVAQP